MFRHNEDVVRQSIFLNDSCELRRFVGPAKRGRPRVRWADYILGKCIAAAGSYNQLKQLWHFEHSSFARWKTFVRKTFLSQVV